MAIQISGCTVIDNSRNLTNIANATTATILKVVAENTRSYATQNDFIILDRNDSQRTK